MPGKNCLWSFELICGEAGRVCFGEMKFFRWSNARSHAFLRWIAQTFDQICTNTWLREGCGEKIVKGHLPKPPQPPISENLLPYSGFVRSNVQLTWHLKLWKHFCSKIIKLLFLITDIIRLPWAVSHVKDSFYGSNLVPRQQRSYDTDCWMSTHTLSQTKLLCKISKQTFERLYFFCLC